MLIFSIQFSRKNYLVKNKYLPFFSVWCYEDIWKKYKLFFININQLLLLFNLKFPFPPSSFTTFCLDLLLKTRVRKKTLVKPFRTEQHFILFQNLCTIPTFLRPGNNHFCQESFIEPQKNPALSTTQHNQTGIWFLYFRKRVAIKHFGNHIYSARSCFSYNHSIT